MTYDYVCSTCSATSCKLWTFCNDYVKDDPRTAKLYCARCILADITARNEDNNVRTLPDALGMFFDARYGLVDSPINYFPAVVCVSDINATTLYNPKLCLAPEVDIAVWRSLRSYVELPKPKFSLIEWLRKLLGR